MKKSIFGNCKSSECINIFNNHKNSYVDSKCCFEYLETKNEDVVYRYL